jgi:CheY-like chemotaxis protein
MSSLGYVMRYDSKIPTAKNTIGRMTMEDVGLSIRVKDEPGSRETPPIEDWILGLVHRLNNHMAPIIGYAQLLALKTADPVTKQGLDKIIDEAKQISHIIQDLPFTLLALPTGQLKDKRENEKRESPERKTIEKSLRERKGLIIDDEISFLDFVSKYLEGEGCAVTAVSHVEIALEIVEFADLDFIICDIKMPEMNGNDFYCALKEKKPSLMNRIIFSTGDALSETTRTFIDSVPNPCINKPFSLSELKEVILSVLR